MKLSAVFKCAVLAVVVWSGVLCAADVAILDSNENTRAYFANAYQPYECNTGDWNLGTEEYNRYWMGWREVLDGMGVEYSVIQDVEVNPTRLRDFKVLILSNNFWLDDAQMRAVNEWVRDGG